MRMCIGASVRKLWLRDFLGGVGTDRVVTETDLVAQAVSKQGQMRRCAASDLNATPVGKRLELGKSCGLGYANSS